MSNEDLDILAHKHFISVIETQDENVNNSYQAGFKKALELVAHLLEQPFNTSRELQQNFAKEFFYFI